MRHKEKRTNHNPTVGRDPQTVDAVADLAQRLLRENTILRDEVDRLNRVLSQYKAARG